MNLSRIAKTSSVLLCGMLAATLAFGEFERGAPTQEQDSPFGKLPPEVLARVTPGEQHAGMAYYLGDWDVTFRITMAGMDGMAPTQGTCSYEWLIDGRWMLSRMKGSMMGTAMEWVHIHGYNNMTMNYETIGFDSMSTDTKFSTGNPSTQDGKTFNFFGTMNEYLTGQINKQFRTVTHQRSADRFDLEIWDPEIGPNGAKVMQFEYSRKK